MHDPGNCSGQRQREPVVTQIVEPCESCGEDTGAGSANFIGRRRISTPAGALAFLCSDCDERIKGRTGRQLSDDELGELVRSGSVAMIAGMPGTH